MDLTVVVPFYNEEEVAPEMHRRLDEALRATGRAYEIVFVDDGSTDRTPALLREIAGRDPRVKVLLLRRNFGQTAALAAGFDHSAGAVVIPMDGDLQHDPAEIPKFLEKIAEGYDVVSGWRARRADSLFLRRIPSRAANWLMYRLSGVPLHDFGTTFKAYRREVLQSIQLFGELHRFLPALASRVGARIAEIPISNIVRPRGSSKYGLRRTFGVFLDLLMVKFLISYLEKPLRIFGALALLSFVPGFLIAGGLMAGWVVHVLSSGDPSYNVFKEHGGLLIFAVMLILMGVQFFTLGIAAEISSRIYHLVGRRPIYEVKEVVAAKGPQP